MSDLASNFCSVCGEPVESAHAIRTDDGDPFPPAATGSFEQAGAHAQVGEREVRVFVHERSDEQ